MIELNQIYCGDCLELMKEIPDKSVDLVLTDPPYGINVGGSKPFGNVGGSNIVKPTDYLLFDDSIPPSNEVFKEMFRISKNQIIFGGNYFIDKLFPSSCWIVWDKDNSGNFADCELAWTSFNSAVRRIKYKWNGMLQEDMTHKEKRYHPTQKPVKLFEWILNKYSKEGETICDPFLGSGTTCVACKKLGRNYIGIDKEPQYVEIARKRIEKVNNHKITDFWQDGWV